MLAKPKDKKEVGRGAPCWWGGGGVSLRANLVEIQQELLELGV